MRLCMSTCVCVCPVCKHVCVRVCDTVSGVVHAELSVRALGGENQCIQRLDYLKLSDVDERN